MAIAQSQAPVANFSAAAGTTITRTITLTSGAVVVVLVSWASSTATLSVADTLGNTYNVIAGSLGSDSGSGLRSQIAVATVTTSGATTITATISASVGERDIWVHEYTGVDTASPVDSSIGANGTSANPSTTITTTAAGAIVSCIIGTTGTQGAGGSYTLGVQQNGNASEDRIGTFAGGVTVNYSNASSASWAIAAVGLNESSGAAPVMATAFNAIPFMGGH